MPETISPKVQATPVILEVTEGEDEPLPVVEYMWENAASYHIVQEDVDTCSAAALRMVYSMTGQPDASEAELISRHRKDIEFFYPGESETAEKIRDKIRDWIDKNNLQERIGNALYAWEIEDGLVTGHMEWMRDRGIILIQPPDIGRPELVAVSAEDVAKRLLSGEPMVVSLLPEGFAEAHAHVVVGAKIEDDKRVTELALLNPLETQGYIQRMPSEQFERELIFAGSPTTVAENIEAERKWVERYAKEGEFYKRGIYIRGFDSSYFPDIPESEWLGDLAAFFGLSEPLIFFDLGLTKDIEIVGEAAREVKESIDQQQEGGPQ